MNLETQMHTLSQVGLGNADILFLCVCVCVCVLQNNSDSLQQQAKSISQVSFEINIPGCDETIGTCFRRYSNRISADQLYDTAGKKYRK